MLLAVLILASSTSAADVNVAPVIGVLYQPIDSSLSPLCPSCSSYVVSSYVQWLQGAGARVALLDWNSSVSVLGQGFEQLSGLVLTGGHCGFHDTAYGSASVALLDMAKEKGEYFPVWGTCQGFQQLCQYADGSMSPSVLHYTGNATEGIAVPLNLTAFASSGQSRMLRDAPPSVIATLTTAEVTLNLHHYSVLANKTLHPRMQSFFDVLATNVIESGPEILSLVEATNFPFYGSQFHAEKNAYEFDQDWERDARIDAAVVHGDAAIEAMQYLARFFVSESRKCPHRWTGGVDGSCVLSYEHPATATAHVATEKWEACYLH